MEDCEKIQESFSDYGEEISLSLAHDLYSIYSEYQYCSSWTNGIKELSNKDIYIQLSKFLDSMEVIS